MGASAHVAPLARRTAAYGVPTRQLAVALARVHEHKGQRRRPTGGKLPHPSIRDGVFAYPTLAESLNNLCMALDA